MDKKLIPALFIIMILCFSVLILIKKEDVTGFFSKIFKTGESDVSQETSAETSTAGTGIVIIDEDKMPVKHTYIDYNNDGLLDLVRLEVDGKEYVYFNKGTKTKAVYKEGIAKDKVAS